MKKFLFAIIAICFFSNLAFAQVQMNKQTVVIPSSYGSGESQVVGFYKRQTTVPIGESIKIPETQILRPIYTIRLGLFEVTDVESRLWPYGSWIQTNPVDPTELVLNYGRFTSIEDAQASLVSYKTALNKAGFTELAKQVYVNQNPVAYIK